MHPMKQQHSFDLCKITKGFANTAPFSRFPPVSSIQAPNSLFFFPRISVKLSEQSCEQLTHCPHTQTLTKLHFENYLCNDIRSFTEIMASSHVGPGQEVFDEPNANVVTPVNVPKSNSYRGG